MLCLMGSVNLYLIFFLSILQIGNFYSSIFKSTETFSFISNLLLSSLGESFISVIGFFTSRTSLLIFTYNFYFLLKISICWFIVIISFKFLHLVCFRSLLGSSPGGSRVIWRGDGIGVLGKNLFNYRYRERLETDSVVGKLVEKKRLNNLVYVGYQ